jgi:peptidyl-tRNA hydrolase, PTH1 family
MRMIVGLGNPGTRYVGTRHNVGFDLLAELATRHSAGASKEKFRSEIREVTIEGEKVLLLKPLTYMNLSGEAVLAARDFHKIEHEQLLIVCDDFALPLGKLRLRANGSGGGQNGLSDIIKRLGTNEIPRLRIGIGPLPAGWDAAGFVLGKFTADERWVVNDSIDLAVKAISVWIRDGLVKAANLANA